MSTNVKGINQQKTKEKEERGDGSMADAIRLLGHMAQMMPSCSTAHRAPNTPHQLEVNRSQSKQLFYRVCHPLSKKNKSAERGGKLTCAQNYNLSVGKIIFV